MITIIIIFATIGLVISVMAHVMDCLDRKNKVEFWEDRWEGKYAEKNKH